MWVGWFATPLIHPDGFQSIGASFGGNAGHLSWPFVGNFEGYAEKWGYHWFGWPMLRCWFTGVLSFSPLGDAFFLHGVRALTGILVAQYVYRRYASVNAAFIACAMILLQKGWFCSMAFLYRPETVAALLLWLAAEPVLTKNTWPQWRKITSITALFLCPMMHPLAVAAGCWVSVLGIAKGRFSARSSWLFLLLRWLLPSLLGVTCLIGYYASNENTYVQLMTTIQTMQAVKMDTFSVLKNMFLAQNNVFYVWPVSALFVISVVGVWQKRVVGNELFCLFASSSLVGLGFAYLIAGGHPNVGHAALMTPFLGLWAAQVYVIHFDKVILKKLVRASSILMVLFCLLPLLLVATAYVQSPPQSPRKKAAEILESALAQTQGRVIIPLSLWEAALKQTPESRSRIRFSTFPNYASAKRRQEYETEVVESMRDGDFLIMVPMTHSSNQAHDIYPWPRHPKYTDESLWDGVASYDSIYNLTIKLGSYEKNDLVLDKLKVFRYKN
jgi:hypothetical protein